MNEVQASKTIYLFQLHLELGMYERLFVSVCVYFMAELWFRVALSSYLSKYMCFYCGIVSEIALRNWKFNRTEQIFTNFKWIFLFVRNKTLILNRLYLFVGAAAVSVAVDKPFLLRGYCFNIF